MAEASAPASSANLGAGFDTLALALDLRCHVVAAPGEEWSVDHVGEHQLAEGSADAVMTAAQSAVGAERSLHLSVRSEIPVARGLGSSAAAFSAGALAAWRATGVEPSREQLFKLVAALEGHGDNAAAAVFGGLQMVTGGGESHSLVLHPELLPVVAVPNTELLTDAARAVLPQMLPRSTVVRSLQRVVALTEGLRTGREDLLAAAVGDEIHEEPRSALNPLAAQLMNAAREAGALYTCWSGAGPSVLALVRSSRRPDVAAALASALDVRGAVLTPDIDATGVE